MRWDPRESDGVRSDILAESSRRRKYRHGFLQGMYRVVYLYRSFVIRTALNYRKLMPSFSCLYI